MLLFFCLCKENVIPQNKKLFHDLNYDLFLQADLIMSPRNYVYTKQIGKYVLKKKKKRILIVFTESHNVDR